MAEWLVHLVGLVIVCKKPDEKRESIYVAMLAEELNFSTSRLKSPARKVGVKGQV